MDVSAQIHQHFLRELLISRQQVLQAELAAAQQGQTAGRQASEPGEVADFKDEAARAQLSDLQAAEQRRDWEELAAVQRALQRLDDGSYGNCVRCGEPIPLPRLRVQPAAERCAVCQAAAEHAVQGQR